MPKSFLLRNALLVIFAAFPSTISLVYFSNEAVQLIRSIQMSLSLSDEGLDLVLATGLLLLLLTLALIHLFSVRNTKTTLAVCAIQIAEVLSLNFSISAVLVNLTPSTYVGGLAVPYFLSGAIVSSAVLEAGVLAEYRRREPYHLMKLDQVLRKGGHASNVTNLTGAPTWYDFEKNFITPRPESGIILKQLGASDLVILVGEQASGKTVILSTVGYELHKRGYIVMLANAGNLESSRAFEEVKRIDSGNAVVLIDDAHRNPSAVSDFVRRARAAKVKIVVGTRPMHGLFKEGETEELIRAYENRVASGVSTEFIEKYFLHWVRLKGINYTASPQDLEYLARSCGTDLWLVNYLLLSWKPDTETLRQVSRASIYDRVYEARFGEWRRLSDKWDTVLFSVSALGQFELGYDERIMQMKGLDQDATRLMDTGAVAKSGQFYGIHHSSVAKLYLDTAEHFRLLRPGQSSRDFTQVVMKDYVQLGPSNLLEAISVGARMFPSLLASELQSIVLSALRNEQDPVTVMRVLNQLSANLPSLAASLLEGLDIDKIAREVNAGDDIAKLVGFAREAGNLPTSKRIFDLLDASVLGRRLDQAANEDLIAFLTSVPKEFGLKIVNNIGSRHIVERFQEEPDWNERAKLYTAISNIDESLLAGLKKAPTIIVGIPTFNESAAIGKLVLSARKYADKVLVCDDGSSDDTGEIAQAVGAQVTRNEKAMGKGSALQILFRQASGDADIFITMDADDAERAKDIPRLIGPIESGQGDLAIGSRYAISDIPAVVAGQQISDTQSGFRAFSRKAVETILNSSELDDTMGLDYKIITTAISEGLRIVEVPISVSYFGRGNPYVARTSFTNPVFQMIDILSSILKLVSIRHPFVFYGIPGLGLLSVGILFFALSVEKFASLQTITPIVQMYFDIGSLFATIGLIIFAIGVILWSLTTLFRSSLRR